MNDEPNTPNGFENDEWIMPNFDYIAINSSGREERGIIAASSVDDVVTQLRHKGCFPTSIAKRTEPSEPSKPQHPPRQPSTAVSNLHAHIECERAFIKLGWAPLRADPGSCEDTLIVYKVLFDWVRSRQWRLSGEDVEDIESAIREYLPNYTATDFNVPL